MKKISRKKVSQTVKKAVKMEKKLVKAVRVEAQKVNGKVKSLSKQAGQAMAKIKDVKKVNTKVMLAEAIAGVTLVASLGAYSFYLVKHPGKKVDFKNMKINILREIHKVGDQAKKMAKQK